MWYKNGIVFNSQQAIRNDNKESSLPHFLSDSDIEIMGYIKVVEGVKPIPTAVQYVVEAPVALVDGVPTTQWDVVDMFADTPAVLDADGVTVITPAKTKLEYETEYLAKRQVDAQEALKEHFKVMYLAHVDVKLKVMDYDSLATVKLWEGDTTFGTEATRILNWYKAIIAMNYALIRSVSTGVAAVPSDAEYQTMLDGVVF